MRKFKTFVEYHGCNIGYKDGTRQIIFKTCSRPTCKPFWKNPEHVTSRVAKSTRAQIKSKPLAYKKDLKNYVNRHSLDCNSEAKRLLEWLGDCSSSDSFTDSDSDYCSDTNSLPDTNYYKTSNLTGTVLLLILKQSQSQNQGQIIKNQNSKKIIKIQTTKNERYLQLIHCNV